MRAGRPPAHQASGLPAPPLPPSALDRAALRARRLAVQAEAFLPLLARPEEPRFPPPEKPEHLSVLAANLAQGVTDVKALAAAIVSIDADVLCLVEHTGSSAAALYRAGLEERWPEVSDASDEGFFGSMVASRHTIDTSVYRDVGGRPGQVIDLIVRDTNVRVVPVHTQAPVLDRDLAVWRQTVEANAALADHVPYPVVLAGDWNATGGNRLFRQVLRHHGLVDAQAYLGRRWFPTWPRPHPKSPAPRWLPPVLPLDHVVVNSGTGVESLAALALPGTDHLALRAVLRLG